MPTYLIILSEDYLEFIRGKINSIIQGSEQPKLLLLLWEILRCL
jgi:hypothetical protein